MHLCHVKPQARRCFFIRSNGCISITAVGPWQTCCGSWSMWRCRTGGAGDRGSEAGASRADQWFESSRWGKFLKRSKCPLSRQKHGSLMVCLWVWKWACVMIQASAAICEEFAGTQLCMSSGAFGNFCTEVRDISSREEDVSILREQRLKWAAGPGASKQGVVGDLLGLCWNWTLAFGAQCWCSWWFASLFQLESYAVAVVLCLGAGCLCCCTGQISFASFHVLL